MNKIFKIAFLGVFLTLFITMGGCDGGGSGGGGGKVEPPTQWNLGASGEICVTGDASYNIRVDGEAAQNISLSQNGALAGSFSSQVLGLTKANVAHPNKPVTDVLVWGAGSTIKYGTPETKPAALVLKRQAQIIDLAHVRVDGFPKIIFATTKGIGLVSINEKGVFKEDDVYSAVPAGIVSMAANEDGSKIVYVTSDGYLQLTSLDKIKAKSPCAQIFAVPAAIVGDSKDYLPVKVLLGGDYAVVLLRNKFASNPIMLSFEEAYNPVFTSMISGAPLNVVRVIDLNYHKTFDLGIATADDSFMYDGFVPTDVSYDGAVIYVAGIAFKKQAVTDFLGSNCKGKTLKSQVSCMRSAAIDGGLTTLDSAFTGGFFNFNKFDALGRAEHFTNVPLTSFLHSTFAPPFILGVSVDGISGYIQGPTFVLSINQTGEGGKWTLGDKADGLVEGVPNGAMIYKDGVAISLRGMNWSDAEGASVIGFISKDGNFTLMDMSASEP